ncbi:class I SAM-dependent DNA methyltransferase [Nocardiopsis prasina]|uniref:class I SAM-dependent DNA methyltransferase n=1 Tax=Nocardiopsis prasina TaxID=2015 RepID=UPI0003676FB1|nr:class I SAM-dependent methyltransferase [Nocardiopsis prasina]
MYGQDFTDISDLIYQGRGKDYRAEAQHLESLIRARLPHARSLLDVGCGTAAHLAAFTQWFDDLAGLDLSESMIATARTKNLPVTLHLADMSDFSLGRTFDVITCMFGSIGHPTSVQALTDTLRCFAHHLTPGGLAAVDPWWFPDTFLDGFVSGDVIHHQDRTIARVSHSVRENNTSRMQVHYTIADPTTGIRHFSETYVASLFTRQQYETAFETAGFDLDYLPHLHRGRGLFLATRR